jgi:chemotaxis methyl-accepting protein methylase
MDRGEAGSFLVDGSQRSHQAANSNAAFDALLAYIRRERGLDCNQYKESFLRRRLVVRMRARSVGTFQDYLAVLRSDPAEHDALLDSLSINHTCFFRDEPVFDVLRYVVLAPLLAERAASRQRSLAIWSAGCADGEEPFSIAMILIELLGQDLAAWTLHIHGTDIDASALARAHQGHYAAASFRDMQADFVRRYFVRRGSAHVLAPEVRQMVTFQQHDVMAPPPRPCYDLILCRNVLIYFTREHQEKVVRHLVAHLNPGGHLVLGMTEMVPMSLIISGRLLAVDGRLRIFQNSHSNSVEHHL